MYKRLMNFHGFRVKDAGEAEAGDTAFSKIEQSFDGPGAFVNSVVESIPLCTHGHAIHSLQEVGGKCICGAMLCKDCAQVKCCLDNQSLCHEHTVVVNGRQACSTHGLLDLLRISFLGNL